MRRKPWLPELGSFARAGSFPYHRAFEAVDQVRRAESTRQRAAERRRRNLNHMRWPLLAGFSGGGRCPAGGRQTRVRAPSVLSETQNCRFRKAQQIAKLELQQLDKKGLPPYGFSVPNRKEKDNQNANNAFRD